MTNIHGNKPIKCIACKEITSNLAQCNFCDRLHCNICLQQEIVTNYPEEEFSICQRCLRQYIRYCAWCECKFLKEDLLMCTEKDCGNWSCNQCHEMAYCLKCHTLKCSDCLEEVEGSVGRKCEHCMAISRAWFHKAAKTGKIMSSVFCESQGFIKIEIVLQRTLMPRPCVM